MISLQYREEHIPHSVTHLTIQGANHKNERIPKTVKYLILDTLENIKVPKTVTTLIVAGKKVNRR